MGKPRPRPQTALPRLGRLWAFLLLQIANKFRLDRGSSRKQSCWHQRCEPMNGQIRYSTGSRVIRFDPDATVVEKAFREVDDNPRAYQNRPPETLIPGFGEPYDECGNPTPHICEDCGLPARNDAGDIAEIGQTCWRRQCPRCAPGWAMRAAYSIVAKLEDYRKHVSSRRNGHSPKFHHITLMPPYKNGTGSFATSTGDPLADAYDMAHSILDYLCVDGGATLYHPFSGRNGDDRGEWKQRLFNGRSWKSDVRQELELRPHFHCLAVADSVDHYTCQHLHERTGWLVHRIENEDNNVSIFNEFDLASAVTYALSHAGVGEEVDDAYRYFGEVANHTASQNVSQAMRRVVRKVVHETLDLHVGGVVCQLSDPGDGDTDTYHIGGSSGSGGSAGPEASGGGDDSDDGAVDGVGSAGIPCGGRLVPAADHVDQIADPALNEVLELIDS